MAVLTDLRYVFPPLLNLVSFLSLTSQNKPEFSFAAFLADQTTSSLKLAYLLLVVLLMLLFLFFSVELPLTLHPIRLQARGFSIPISMSLVASILLPPSLFWPAYVFIIITAPWYNQLFDQFIHFFRCFALTLRSIPTILVTITQNRENPNEAPPQVVELEGDTVENEGEC